MDNKIKDIILCSFILLHINKIKKLTNKILFTKHKYDIMFSDYLSQFHFYIITIK